MRRSGLALPLLTIAVSCALASCEEQSTEPALGLLQVRNLRPDTVGIVVRNRDDAMQYIPIDDTLPTSFLAARTLAPGNTTLVPLDEIRAFGLQTHVRLLVYRVRGNRAEYQTSVDAPGLALQQMRYKLDIPAPL